MTKPSIIPNWGYTKPSKGGHRNLKKVLKYVAYRETPDHNPLEPHARWTDCGIGDSWKKVYQKLAELKGPYILAHHLVISPAPDLMEMVPEELRHEFVREVTERTIEQWHIERGLNIPEYSHCLHSRDTNDPEERKEQLHSHVFIAGTIEDEAGERQSVRVNREQVVADPRSMKRTDNLHRIARQEMESLLDRTIGLDWRELRQPELEPDELMPPITTETPEPKYMQVEPPSVEMAATPDLGLDF